MSANTRSKKASVSVRAMLPGDLPAAMRLCARLFPDAKRNLGILEQCASRRKDHAHSLAVVAAAQGRLAAVLCCHLTRDRVLAPDTDSVAWLDLVGVAPGFRRSGIATRLWERMEKDLAKRGIPAAWTRSRALGWG